MNYREDFVIKHYAGEKNPCIKGNGFDGLLLGEDRQEAQEFVDYINGMKQKLHTAEKKLSTSKGMLEQEIQSRLESEKELTQSRELLRECEEFVKKCLKWTDWVKSQDPTVMVQDGFVRMVSEIQ